VSKHEGYGLLIAHVTVVFSFGIELELVIAMIGNASLISLNRENESLDLKIRQTK